MRSLQVGRYTSAHVLKIQRHLVQPCVDLDTIRSPFKGLRRVDFNALVSDSMTIGSKVTLRLQVHTRVTTLINIRRLSPHSSNQAI